MVNCEGCGTECFNDLCCPKCLEFDKTSFFCSQLCFDTSWTKHVNAHCKLTNDKTQSLELLSVNRSADAIQLGKDDNVTKEKVSRQLGLSGYMSTHSTNSTDWCSSEDTTANMVHAGTTIPDGASKRATDCGTDEKGSYNYQGKKTTLKSSETKNIKSLRLYDPESNTKVNSKGAYGERKLSDVSTWLTEATEKLSQSLDLGKSMESSEATRTHIEKQMRFKRGPASLSSSKTYRSYRLRKNIRRAVFFVICCVIFLAAYLLSIKLVDIVEQKIIKNYHLEAFRGPEPITTKDGGTSLRVDNTNLVGTIDSLRRTVEEMRIEVTKLKDVVYSNSVALNGLTKGAYKLPGSDDSKGSVKKSKFGKKNPQKNLNNGNVNQNFDTKIIADSADNTKQKGASGSSDLSPNTIEHSATIAIQNSKK